MPADPLGTGEDILDEGVEGHVPIPPDDQAPKEIVLSERVTCIISRHFLLAPFGPRYGTISSTMLTES